MDRSSILDEILNERTRQFNMPGVEFDIKNSPNDWAALISSYATRNLSHKNIKPDVLEYREDLIAAAAVVLAAIEHIDNMKAKNFFR